MSLGKKMLLSAAAVVLFLAAVFIPIDTYISYRSTVERSAEQVEQIYATHIPSLVSSLWLTHYDLLEDQIEAISRFPYIAHVQVHEEGGESYLSDGEVLSSASSWRKIREPLVYSRRGREAEIGTLILYVDQGLIRSDAWKMQFPELIYHIAVLVFITGAVAFVFQRTAGRHLVMITDYLKKTFPDEISPSLRLNRTTRRKDEVDYLVESINALQERIRKHLKEKDLLIREVHHRIKNNLASIVSLLNLQAVSQDNSAVSESLLKASGRLHSMSVLYDKLYRSSGITRGLASEYLNPLVDEIIRLTGENKDIRTEKEIENIDLNIKSLNAMGIILNELITNSVKYAFPHTDAGRITIHLIEKEPGTVEFTYRDNGIGLPDEVIRNEKTGLGMIIITSLSEQLQGSPEIRNRDGMEMRLSFCV